METFNKLSPPRRDPEGSQLRLAHDAKPLRPQNRLVPRFTASAVLPWRVRTPVLSIKEVREKSEGEKACGNKPSLTPSIRPSHAAATPIEARNVGMSIVAVS